jgi:hypothetical protein
MVFLIFIRIQLKPATPMPKKDSVLLVMENIQHKRCQMFVVIYRIVSTGKISVNFTDKPIVNSLLIFCG